jgi:hypothetical protein
MEWRMTILRLSEEAAQAATNALRFVDLLEEVAVRLFRWQHDLHGALVPASFPVPNLPAADTDSCASDASHYQRQALAIRHLISATHSHAKRGTKAERPSYLLAGGHVWYLAQRSAATQSGSEAVVRDNAATYIRLVLQKELYEQSAIAVTDTDPVGGFGPGVYLLHKVGNQGRKLQLAELRFDVTAKYGLLICNVRACSFYKRDGGRQKSIGTVDTGQGYMVNVMDVGDRGVKRLDAREHPIPGINLRKTAFRHTRLYYLNILTEFALSVFQRAGIRVERDVFIATHCVQDGYLPLAPIAHLTRPLVVVNATSEPLRRNALLPLRDVQAYFGRCYHVAGHGSVEFMQPEVQVAPGVPDSPANDVDYLYLNGAEINGASAWVQRAGAVEREAVSRAYAYSCLDEKTCTADVYTRAKYKHLMDREAFDVCMQGLNASPEELAALGPYDGPRLALHEKLKRCLVELSLKEIVTGCKPFPASTFPPDLRGRALTLVGTRSVKTRRAYTKQIIVAVDVEIDKDSIWVRGTRRTPWSNERIANLSFVEQYSFLLDDNNNVRDNQFWVVDTLTGKRLCAWNGSFIPKIILNNRYAGIEAALACQDEAASGNGLSFYSKSKSYNLLPYYISMLPPQLKARAEQMGRFMPLQDCGSWVRVFVPPADGIDGTGSSLSCMRDVMIYNARGALVTDSLLDEPLLQIYLHTMTNGILVSGGNSKMSILEKFVRLTLEN